MNKLMGRKIAWIFVLVAGAALADSAAIEGNGVYARDGDGYVKLQRLEVWDIYYKHIKGVPFIKAQGSQPELIINYPNLNLENVSVEAYAHPLLILAQNNLLHAQIEALPGKPGMLRVTFEEQLDSATLLDVTVYGADFRGVVALSDPVQALIKIYREGEHTASSAVYDLDELIQVFPEVAEFKTLRAQWQARADADTDHLDYKLVTDTYAKYEASDSLEMKVHWLRETLKLIQNYRDTHPQGLHLQEAEDLEAVVKKKLRL